MYIVIDDSQALRKSLLETTRVTVAVPEAPVFRPTAQEFADPLSYISSIQTTAAAAGIAKIIPPPGTESTDGICVCFLKDGRHCQHSI
jgi:jmjN domain